MKKLFILVSILLMCSPIVLFSQETKQKPPEEDINLRLYRAGIIDYETYQAFLKFDAEMELIRRMDEGDEKAIQELARINSERRKRQDAEIKASANYYANKEIERRAMIEARNSWYLFHPEPIIYMVDYGYGHRTTWHQYSIRRNCCLPVLKWTR